MKKKFLFLMALLAVSLLALAEMRVYVYKKDGTKVSYVASTVDSIGFVDVNNFADGHEWVDLGLPSGTKWAACNVGADSPEECGDYFAWGETTPKSSYTQSNYNYSSNPTTLPLDRDAAYTNWGTSWRMPTRAEFKELKANCTWTNTTQNCVRGYIVTGPNGYSIFLPVTGHYSSEGLNSADIVGCYWSSSCESNVYWADGWEISTADSFDFVNYFRYWGISVRPVLRE